MTIAGMPVLNTVGLIGSAAVLVVADAAIIKNLFAGTAKWGIFDAQNKPVITADSVVAVDYRKEYRIADFPVEGGAFASYNKVATPFEIKVTLAASGKGTLLSSLLSGGAISAILTGATPSADGRKTFLAALDAACANLALVSVLTPEATYSPVNITHYDYRRSAEAGATLLLVDVWCNEVRVTAKRAPFGTLAVNAPTTEPAVTAAQNPASVDPANGGSVQANQISGSQVANLPAAEPGAVTGVGSAGSINPVGAGGAGTVASESVDTGSGAPDTVSVNASGAYTIPAGANPAYYYGGQYVGANPSADTLAAIRATTGTP